MQGLKPILFIAKNDLKVVLREFNTILWLFIMPGIFFYFIGTVTQGGVGITETAVPLLVDNQDTGFLGRHLEQRLEENLFEPEDFKAAPKMNDRGEEISYRILTIPTGFTEKVLKGEQATLTFKGRRADFGNDYDFVRIQKAAYTVLADVLVAETGEGDKIEDRVQGLLAVKPLSTLEVSSAGKRAEIPSGFEQAIPGTLVMFTLLVLLTSGAISLYQDREQQLLRRLASAPFSRAQIVAGKWTARMGLAMVQIGVAIGISITPIFGMEWGASLPMVLIILFGWAALCTSLSILLGSLGKSEGQVIGFGVLSAMVLAALGGCWWPIEVAPEWMQDLQMFIPTGWTMDALHKLINFAMGWQSALPNLIVLLAAAFATGWLAARKFRFI